MSRFKQDDAPRVYEIEQHLITIQQGSKDVGAYYTESITFWENIKTMLRCLCVCMASVSVVLQCC